MLLFMHGDMEALGGGAVALRTYIPMCMHIYICVCIYVYMYVGAAVAQSGTADLHT